MASVVVAVVITILAGLSATMGVLDDRLDWTLHELGFLFAAGALVCLGIGGRITRVSALVVAFAGVAFGFWFPWVYSLAGYGVQTWLVEPGFIAESMGAATETASAVLSAGVLTGIALAIAAGDARFVVRSVMLSLVAAGVVVSPLRADIGAAVGAVLWNAGMAASLAEWVVDHGSPRRPRCRSCGYDMTALSTPVCPKCKKSTRNERDVSGDPLEALTRNAA